MTLIAEGQTTAPKDINKALIDIHARVDGITVPDTSIKCPAGATECTACEKKGLG